MEHHGDCDCAGNSATIGELKAEIAELRKRLDDAEARIAFNQKANRRNIRHIEGKLIGHFGKDWYLP